MEDEIKQKLGSNYNSVRAAFLDLDIHKSGFISGEEFSKLLKYGLRQKDPNSTDKSLDYTLLEYLIKLRCKQEHTNISYTKFCTWLGPAIEPPEGFYFRHDSYKNPHYDLNMELKVEPNLRA